MGRRPGDINLSEIKLPFNVSELGVPLLIVILVLWAALGQVMFKVDQDEQGVITTFGEVTDVLDPGLHFKMPYPVQHVYRPRVTEAKRTEIGFRTIDSGPPARYDNAESNPRLREEAEMLTGDENIVSSEMIVQFRITDAHAYLFNLAPSDRGEPGPDAALHDLAQAVQRQVVGDRPIDEVLTVGKTEIQAEIQERLQELVDLYEMGLRIITVKLQEVQAPREVAGAFKDVATAKEDKERIINQAQGYANEKIPEARGEAARLMREAEAYRQTRLAEAEGDVARFLALATEYEKAPEITRQRLYLETMQKVLRRTKKVILDKDSGVLNLNQLQPAGQGAQ